MRFIDFRILFRTVSIAFLELLTKQADFDPFDSHLTTKKKQFMLDKQRWKTPALFIEKCVNLEPKCFIAAF
jgi:hypothetical protein